jgi:hypothetical protein
VLVIFLADEEWSRGDHSDVDIDPVHLEQATPLDRDEAAELISEAVSQGWVEYLIEREAVTDFRKFRGRIPPGAVGRAIGVLLNPPQNGRG